MVLVTNIRQHRRSQVTSDLDHIVSGNMVYYSMVQTFTGLLLLSGERGYQEFAMAAFLQLEPRQGKWAFDATSNESFDCAHHGNHAFSISNFSGWLAFA